MRQRTLAGEVARACAVEPGTRLADQLGLPSFAEIAGLLASLRVADADHGGRLPPQTERVEFLFALIGRRLKHARVGPLVRADLAERGHRLARSLAAGGTPGWYTGISACLTS